MGTFCCMVGAQSLKHWTTSEVSHVSFRMMFVCVYPHEDRNHPLMKENRSAPLLLCAKPKEERAEGRETGFFLLEWVIITDSVCEANVQENIQERALFIRCPGWSLAKVHAATAAAAKLLQSCPTLCNPVDGSPRGSPVPGILQARTLEWVAISTSPMHESEKWKWSRSVVSDS